MLLFKIIGEKNLGVRQGSFQNKNSDFGGIRAVLGKVNSFCNIVIFVFNFEFFTKQNFEHFL